MLKRFGVSENFAGSAVHVALISLEDSPALLWWGKKVPGGHSGFCFALLLFTMDACLCRLKLK